VFATQTVQLGGASATPIGSSGNFTVLNTVFPATPVGQSTTHQVILQLNQDLVLKSIAIQSGFTEYTIAATGAITGCTVDGVTLNPAGTNCYIAVTFAPSAPGNGNVPTNARTAPLVVVCTLGGGVGVPYAFGLTGTGTGPVAALTPGIMSAFAGAYGGEYVNTSGGPATQAVLGWLNGMALDSAGNAYISDSLNDVIWHVDTNGIISIYAGTTFDLQGGRYLQGMNGDGEPALGAHIAYGGPLALDAAGGLYLGDNDGNDPARLRYINSVSGILTTLVGGSGAWAPNTRYYQGAFLPVNISGVNYLFKAMSSGVSTSAPASPFSTQLPAPTALNSYVTDGTVSWQNQGRIHNGWSYGAYNVGDSFQMTLTTCPGGISGAPQCLVNYLFTAIQAGHTGNGAPPNDPADFPTTFGATATDGGTVIWQNAGPVTNVYGMGCANQTDNYGDGCTGLNATILGIRGIALDQAGNIYFSDWVPGGYIIWNYNAHTDNHAVVRRMDAGTGVVSIYAGNGTPGHSGDGGPATQAAISPSTATGTFTSWKVPMCAW
jgi:hypothetical protein